MTTTSNLTPAAAVEIALDEYASPAGCVGYAISELGLDFGDLRPAFEARRILFAAPDDALFADAGWVEVYGELVHTETGAVLWDGDDRERDRVAGELLAAAHAELRSDMADGRRNG